MATHWIITTLEQEQEIEEGIESNAWVDRMITVREVMGLLDLISHTTIRCKRIKQGEIVICADNKTIINEICKPIKKESHVTGEAEATIAAIRVKIEK